MAAKAEGSSRKAPRRLFSFDSNKSSSTRRSASESSFASESSSSSLHHFHAPSQPTLLENVHEEPLVSPRAPFLGRSSSPSRSASPTADKTKRRPQPVATDRPLSPGAEGAPRSPSVIRWQTLRQQYQRQRQPTTLFCLFIFSIHTRPFAIPDPETFQIWSASRIPTSSRGSSSQANERIAPFPGYATRQYRLARELQRACWAARTVDVAFAKSNRAEQYLPFMSRPLFRERLLQEALNGRTCDAHHLCSLWRCLLEDSRWLPPLIHQTLLHHCRPADAIPSVPVLQPPMRTTSPRDASLTLSPSRQVTKGRARQAVRVRVIRYHY
ncbi:hypothetical protein C8F01DRAFT_675182 [Mycena amicta]|nr:hypothetical protein C8F01DRAFT_675182 [Mycena amicta]